MCSYIKPIFNSTSYVTAKPALPLDIDECEEGTHHCNETASCVDTEGSFLCICNPGYTGDGVYCQGLLAQWQVGLIMRDNACALNLQTLMNAATIQTITAHHWQNVQILLEALLVTVFQHILAMGLFVTVNYLTTTSCCLISANISDIDECSLDRDNCDERARCNNTFGSFFCQCGLGYRGNGTINNCSKEYTSE